MFGFKISSNIYYYLHHIYLNLNMIDSTMKNTLYNKESNVLLN